VTLNLSQLVLLGIATAAIHWLMSRAAITQPIWSRAPKALDALLRCPSCSGFWLGLGVSAAGVHPVEGVSRWLGLVGAAVLAMFLTPVFEAVMLWGLGMSTVEEEDTHGATTTGTDTRIE